MRCNYTYSSFGELEGRSGYTENSYQFAGEQFDKNLSEYYLRQRYYNTATGRFTRRDSYKGDFRNPLTLHKYLYANANPINLVDPKGLTATSVNELNVGQIIVDLLAISIGIYGTLSNALKATDRALSPLHISEEERSGDVPSSDDSNVDSGSEVGPYSDLEDPPNVGSGKDFTAAQKRKIYEANRSRNGGVLRDDETGEILVSPEKSQKGVSPPSNEAQVDHIIPRNPADPNVEPGTNSYKNARVISRARNRAKSNRYP